MSKAKEFPDELDWLRKIISSQSAEIARLREALEPFARESDNWGTSPDDDSPLAYAFDLPDGYGIQLVMCDFTAKDFYHARAALEPHK